MDRSLDALVNLDVPADLVRIEICGSLNQDSRADLVHMIRRVRRMGIRSHIRVDLSRAIIVESSALAGLRSDLNSLESNALTGTAGSGVALHLTPAAEDWTGGQHRTPLTVVDDDVPTPTDGPDFSGAFRVPVERLEGLYGRNLAEYSNDELLAASDSLFALLDVPQAFSGSDLLGRYDDICAELQRRQEDHDSRVPAVESQSAS
ncbi:hypothetical protein ACRB8A_02765 [Arthrobacter sp. G.S.26]|uniref:hypothetical protein n=1 Tax=Micrococcaceae TaxID=1268 RepID=UPI002552F5C9|nr:hypothetical protein [Pseudarthrobacter sp. MEB009]